MVGAGNVFVVENGGPQSEYRLQIATELGADDVVNDADPNERINSILKLSHGRGADLVIECTGVPQAVAEGLDMMRRGGVYLEMGNFVDAGQVTISPHQHILMKEAHIIGVSGWPWQASNRVLTLLKRHLGTIPFSKIVTHTFTIEEAERAIETAMKENAVKVVIGPEPKGVS